MTFQTGNIFSNMDTYRLSKIATCSHCSQLYAVRDPLRPRGFRCPLVLPCGHTVCEFCVRNSVQTSATVSCALCHSKVEPLKEESLRNKFPINMYLLGCFADSHANKGLIDSKIVFQPAGANLQFKKPKKVDVKSIVSVPNCSECGAAPAASNCLQCAVMYCERCFTKIHRTAKALQKHTKIQLGLERCTPTLRPMCEVHSDQKIEYHCKDCDATMCPRCALEGHKNHAIWTIQERNESMLPNVREAYNRANIVLRRLMKTQKEVKNTMARLEPTKKGIGNNRLVQTQHAVSRHFVHLHGALQLLEASILNQLEQANSGTTRSLEHVAHDLDDYIGNVSSLLEEAVAACDPADLPKSDMTGILEKLQEAEKLPCHLVTLDACEDVEVSFMVDETFVQQVTSHCHLTVPEPKKFSLARTDELPEDYKIEDIPDAPSELSSTSRASSLSALSDSALSDTSSVTSLPQGFNLAQPIKGSTEIVSVNHIKDPSSFYVVRESDKRKLEILSREIKAYIARGPKPPTVVLKDSLYVVQYDVDKNWYRARVTRLISSASELEEDKIQVIYIDYGNIGIVPASRLRCINPKHAAIPPFAQHCRLYDLTPIGEIWKQDAAVTMAAMLEGCRVMMTVMGESGGMLDVDLCRCPSGEDSYIPMSVRDAMVFLELGCFVESNVPSIHIPAGQKQYLAPEVLKKGEIYDVTVSYINHPSSFYVQKLGCHAQYLSSLMQDLNKMYQVPRKQSMLYTPKIGMVCAAKFSQDGRWYRARITEIPGNRKVEVFYVDFGNQEVVEWTALQTLHERFLRLAPQAIHSALSDVVPISGNVWSEDAKLFFLNITVKKILKLFVDEVVKTVTNVTLYESQTTVDICLNALLVKNKFALSTGSSSALVEYHKTGMRVLLNQSPQMETRKTARVERGRPLQPKQIMKRKKTKIVNNKGIKNDNSSDSSQKSASTHVPEPEPEIEVEPEEGRFRLEVSILSADNPSCIYVSLTSQESVIDDLMTELQAYYKNTKDTDGYDQLWKPNDKCCAFSSTEKKWFRGIIIEVTEDWAKVFLKDFAFVDTVPIAYLRPLAPEFMEVCDGAVKCNLAGIKAAGDKSEWPSLACEQLVDLINQYDRHFISKKGEIKDFSLPIELWVKEVITSGPLDPTIEEWVTLNWKLVDQGLAIPIRSDTVSKGVPSHQVLQELKEQKRDTGPIMYPKRISVNREHDQELITADPSNDSVVDDENQQSDSEIGTGGTLTDWLPAAPITKKKFQCIPSYVDDDAYIYLHEVESEETLQVIQKALQTRLQHSQAKPHDLYWFAGQLCMAKYHDKKWYRGKVLEVKDDNSVKVLFVDYGNVEELKVVDMRKNIYMGHIPIQCHKYKLDGVVPIGDTWPVVALDFMHSTIVEKRCKVNILSDPEDGSPPLISLTSPGGVDLAGLLVNMQYARYTSNAMQVKAAIEPFRFTTKVNSDSLESDQESDEASIIIEEETVNDIDDEGSQVPEERGNHDSVCSVVEKEGEIVGDEPSANVCVDNMVESNIDVSNVVKESQVQAVTEEKSEVKLVLEKECVQDIAKSKEDTAQDYEKEFVLQAQGQMQEDELLLVVGETGEKLLTETQERTDTLTAIGKDSVMKTHTEETAKHVHYVIEDETDNATKMDEVVLKNCTEEMGETEVSKGIVIKTDPELKVTEGEKEDIDLIMTAETKEPKSWADLLSDEEASDQDELQLEYKPFNLLAYDELTVEVTAIISPNEVAIRPVECEENAEIIKDFLVLSIQMQEQAPYQPIVTSPSVGQPCCVCFKEDGQWYRATVLDLVSDASQLKIQYVDYGNVEVVDFHEVHEIKPEWTKVPLQGIRCRLWKVKAPAIFDPLELLTRLTDCLFQPPLRARIKDRQPSCTSVELYPKHGEVPVYQALLDSGALLYED